MTDDRGRGGGRITRRRFVRDVGIATVAAAEALNPESAVARTRPARPRPRRSRGTVAIFGGGIAGLTAAHELGERGFEVTVYERRAWGGKARSTWIPGSASGGRRPLPGEHGWRTWFGFYQNTVETMRRIPFGSNANGVFDNLVGSTEIGFAQDGGRRDVVLSLGRDRASGFAPQFFAGFAQLPLYTDITEEAVAYFFGRLAVYMSSCDARRFGQWEHTPWTEFTGSDRFGGDYRKLMVNALSEVVQASKAERTSTEFSARVLEVAVYNVLGRYSNGQLIRFLNGPSNEVLFDPWLSLLRRLGVRLELHQELIGLSLRRGRITEAHLHTAAGRRRVSADWYLCALPVERARRLWSPAILAADPQLGRMWKLDTAWMNGMKFFLDRRVPIVNGLIDYVDSPWRVTSVSQAQFWPVDFAATYGDGRVHESLSAIVSKWTAPGLLYGKPATDCTPEEVVREVWEQIKRHVNKPGRPAALSDDMLVRTDIDHGMLHRGGRLISADPLVLPTVGQRPDRPETTTAIPNLILAGDYLRGNGLEVANMEVASYNGRWAANAILAGSGSRSLPAATIEPPSPPEWAALKRIDAERYAAGQPNIFDGPESGALAHLAEIARQIPNPLADAYGRLLAELASAR